MGPAILPSLSIHQPQKNVLVIFFFLSLKILAIIGPRTTVKVPNAIIFIYFSHLITLKFTQQPSPSRSYQFRIAGPEKPARRQNAEKTQRQHPQLPPLSIRSPEPGPSGYFQRVQHSNAALFGVSAALREGWLKY